MRAALCATAAAALLVAACSSDGGSPPATATSTTSQAAQGSTTASGGDANHYVNPVYGSDFPDPAVLYAGGVFHAYATQGQDKNIQTLTSTDLAHWKPGPDALPEVGRWASAGNTWAPEVIKTGQHYSMYYVAHDDKSNVQCIGHATANGPAGPFRDQSPQPLVCQSALGGSIDADPVRTPDGKLYLYWKNDGNCCGKPVHLWGQRLSADGGALTGTPTKLLTNTKSWQGTLIEAPEMVAHGSSYTLFYSANDYASTHYGIGYAHCRGPLGPCTDRSDASLIASNEVAAGPGHCFVLTLADGRTWMLYHAWPPDAIGSTSPGRQLWLEPLTWKGDVPEVHASDTSPQPLPNA